MRISKELARELVDHAVADLPNECCGMIAGRGGTATRVLPAANSEGSPFMYVMDPATGQVHSATSFVRNTAAKGVDLTTGRLIPNEQKHPQTGKRVRDITPASPGAKDWCPSAFSPRTNLLYVPALLFAHWRYR